MNTVNTPSLQELKVKIARRLSSLSPKYSYKLWMDRLDKLCPAEVYVLATQILYPKMYIAERRTSEEKSLEKRIELEFEKQFERKFLEEVDSVPSLNDQFALAKGKALSDHVDRVRSFAGTRNEGAGPKEHSDSDSGDRLFGKRKPLKLF